MRFAYFALTCVLSGTAAAFLACSGDDTGTTPGTSSSSSSTSSSSSSSSSSSGQTGDDDEEVDSGLKYAPPGCSNPGTPSCCLVHSTDYQKGAIAKSVPRDGVAGGGVAWATPEGAISEDGNFTTVTLEEGQESAYLALNDFKFDVPDDKATWGITVELKRQSIDGGVADATIEVLLDTAETPRNKVLKGTWPRLIVGTHHYGQEIDTWGTNLNPVNVRKTTFGTRIAAKRVEGITGPVFARVDTLKIRVSYCNADGK
jgi:hypothetical protein